MEKQTIDKSIVQGECNALYVDNFDSDLNKLQEVFKTSHDIYSKLPFSERSRFKVNTEKIKPILEKYKMISPEYLRKGKPDEFALYVLENIDATDNDLIRRYFIPFFLKTLIFCGYDINLNKKTLLNKGIKSDSIENAIEIYKQIESQKECRETYIDSISSDADIISSAFKEHISGTGKRKININREKNILLKYGITTPEYINAIKTKSDIVKILTERFMDKLSNCKFNLKRDDIEKLKGLNIELVQKTIFEQNKLKNKREIVEIFKNLGWKPEVIENFFFEEERIKNISIVNEELQKDVGCKDLVKDYKFDFEIIKDKYTKIKKNKTIDIFLKRDLVEILEKYDIGKDDFANIIKNKNENIKYLLTPYFINKLLKCRHVFSEEDIADFIEYGLDKNRIQDTFIKHYANKSEVSIGNIFEKLGLDSEYIEKYDPSKKDKLDETLKIEVTMEGIRRPGQGIRRPIQESRKEDKKDTGISIIDTIFGSSEPKKSKVEEAPKKISTLDLIKKKVNEQVQIREKEKSFLGQATEKDILELLRGYDGLSKEFECSVGNFDGEKFHPGISFIEYNALIRNLKDKKVIKTRDVVEIGRSEFRGEYINVRKITHDRGTEWEMKRLIKSKDDKKWGLRFRLSKEERIERVSNFIPLVRRERERLTFQYASHVNIDVTKVTETQLKGEKPSTRKKYEVEIEFTSHAIIDRGVILNVENIGKIILDILLRIQNTNLNMLMTNFEKDMIITVHNSLFGKKLPFMHRNYWNKPTNIKLPDLFNPKSLYAITLKLDGVRKFLLVTKNATYACNPEFSEILRVAPGNSEYDGTLLDTEEYNLNGNIQYYVFDILFCKKTDCRTEKLFSRLKTMRNTVKGLNSNRIITKGFYFEKDGEDKYNLNKTLNKAFEEYYIWSENGYNLDGLIFQPLTEYKNKYTRKWKPKETLSIDFALKKVGDKYIPLVKDKAGLVEFRGTKYHPYEGFIEYNGEHSEDMVFEFLWENNKFVFHRKREDKLYPNAVTTAEDVWKDIVNPLSKEDLLGKTFKLIRYYHNNVKKELIEKYTSGDTVLMDWGSGRGGDLSKWKNIRKVYCVEPSVSNLEELKKRLNKTKNKEKIFIINKKAQDLNDNDYSQDVDCITAFFSLGFMFEDPVTFASTIKNIKDILVKKGSMFVAIVMDGEQVKNTFEANLRDDETVFDYDEFVLEKKSEFSEEEMPVLDKNKFSLEIKDPDSMVKGQDEWMFFIPYFVEQMNIIGFDEEENIDLRNTEYSILSEDNQNYNSFYNKLVFRKRE